MIIRCYSCGKRISDQAETCPRCHEAVGRLTPEQQEKLRRRRLQIHLFRARAITHIAMLTVLLAMFWWWLGRAPAAPEGSLVSLPMLLIGLGLVGYVAGWMWMLYLRFELRRRR